MVRESDLCRCCCAGSPLSQRGRSGPGGEADTGGLAGFLGEQQARERLKTHRVNKLITEAG